MTFWEKMGRALGYEDCDTEAFRTGEFLRSINGYCLCAKCSEMTDEEVEARLGRSVYDEPVWFRASLYEGWDDEDWERQIAETDRKKREGIVDVKVKAAVG